jgi:hypothetical protein
MAANSNKLGRTWKHSVQFDGHHGTTAPSSSTTMSNEEAPAAPGKLHQSAVAAAHLKTHGWARGRWVCGHKLHGWLCVDAELKHTKHVLVPNTHCLYVQTCACSIART